MSQRDVKNRIASVKNIEKITRAMQMVAAARLRRAEQRIEHLRPYADAIRRMTRQAAQAAGNIPSVPILKEHEQVGSVGLLLVTGDRGLAGAFNSQIIRAGVRNARAHQDEGHDDGVVRLRPPRRLVAELSRLRAAGLLRRLHRSPGLRQRTRDRRRRDGLLRRPEGRPRGDHLQPLRLRPHPAGDARDAAPPPAGERDRRGGRGAGGRGRGARRPRRDAGAGRVRARPRGDPAPPRSRLRRDLDLPRAARVDRVRARRAHDRDAQRVREREGPDGRPDPGR